MNKTVTYKEKKRSSRTNIFGTKKGGISNTTIPEIKGLDIFDDKKMDTIPDEYIVKAESRTHSPKIKENSGLPSISKEKSDSHILLPRNS